MATLERILSRYQMSPGRVRRRTLSSVVLAGVRGRQEGHGVAGSRQEPSDPVFPCKDEGAPRSPRRALASWRLPALAQSQLATNVSQTHQRARKRSTTRCYQTRMPPGVAANVLERLDGHRGAYGAPGDPEEKRLIFKESHFFRGSWVLRSMNLLYIR